MEVDPEHGSRRNERNAGRAEELALAGRGGDEYHPAFVKLGTPHPDRVCETQALSYATVPRPTYTPLMKTEEGALSTVQAETLIYANQRFGCFSADGSRAGFFLGDGVGLGKGRQLAAIIYENWLHGRKRHVWLSVSPDLLKDAQRDLRDIGASGLPLHALAAQPYGRLEVPDGVLFATCARARHQPRRCAAPADGCCGAGGRAVRTADLLRIRRPPNSAPNATRRPGCTPPLTSAPPTTPLVAARSARCGWAATRRSSWRSPAGGGARRRTPGSGSSPSGCRTARAASASTRRTGRRT